MLRQYKPGRRLPRRAALIAIFAGFAATGVSADTLAQPKDDTLERTAANYVRFREDVAAIEAVAFDSAAATREAHRRLSAHSPDKLTAGWVAYAALVAADTPEFAEALKKEVKKKPRRNQLGGQKGFLSNLAQDPSYARKLKGADKAVDAVLAMIVQDGARIEALGEAFKQQAYAMQKTKWGKQRIASSQERLKEADKHRRKRGGAAAPHLDRNLDGGVLAPSLASADGQWSADWGQSNAHGQLTEGNAQVIIDRILNLAARYSTGSLNAKVVEVYAKNNKSKRCLEMAKLTLDQCIAATRTSYEEAFCLGEHGLKDVSTCTGWVASAGAS
ncbi:MAG: hypothetical protein JKX88_11275 [Marinicaulis sp.]|nr:hypothetical protein [Marinicaulis sp.]